MKNDFLYVVTTYAAALEDAIATEMRVDPTVFHMGTLQPAGLLAEFGPERVRRTPISEAAMTGAAIGAAGCGLRPVVNWRCVTFTFMAFDQIVNQAAKLRYMSGGQRDFPIVFRTFYIGGMRSAAQHSQTGYSMFAHAAGLKIVAPSTPADAMGLLRSAIRDDDPVVCFEANRLDGLEGEVPDDHVVPLGVAEVKRPGDDLTVVAIGSMVGPALVAAEALADAGIEAEILDPRTLVPLDIDAIRASVRRTGRLVVADESPVTCSMAAEIAALVCEDRATFRALRAPVRRVCAQQVPVPYSPPLEDFVFPDADDIAEAARELIRG
jgi:pyruvate/2-oxoglutarate/acetoin dehydrogenase E1 component